MPHRNSKMSPAQLSDAFFGVFYRAFTSAQTVNGITTITHEGIPIVLDTQGHTVRVGVEGPQPLQEGAEEMLRAQFEKVRDRAVTIARTPPPAPPREPRRIAMDKGGSKDRKLPTSIALSPADKRSLADLADRQGLSQTEVMERAYKVYERLVERGSNAKIYIEDPTTKQRVEILLV